MLSQSFVSSNKKKLDLIKITASLFFILGTLMSHDLWIQHRNFPTIPIIDDFVQLSPFIDSALFYAMIVLLLVSTSLKNKIYLIAFFAILFFLLFQDQIRWQPWVYIYILVLLPFLLKLEKNSRESVINYLQLLFIGIYLWSGIHKFNANFSDYIVEGFARYLFNISTAETLDSIKSFGYIFPCIEIFAALFLTMPKTRKIGLFAIIFMHLFIIVYISPLGMNYNYIILPWNIFMIITGILLFYNSKRLLLFRGRTLVHKLLTLFVMLIMFLPALNFFNYWDSYLSFSLYSGKIDSYYVLSKDDFSSKQINYDIKNYIATKTEGQNGGILYIDSWANNELHVPMYPEERLFKKIAKSICAEEESASDFIFLSTRLPIWKLYDSKKPNIQEDTTNYSNQILFFKFKKGIKNDSFEYFVCEDLNN